MESIFSLVDILSSHAGNIEAYRDFLDSFWYSLLMRLDESFTDHIFSNRMVYWSCTTHSGDIFHHTLISIAYPDPDDCIVMVSDGPIIMEICTCSCFHRERDRSIEYTRNTEGSRAILPIREDICKKKVRRTFLRYKTGVGMNNIL